MKFPVVKFIIQTRLLCLLLLLQTVSVSAQEGANSAGALSFQLHRGLLLRADANVLHLTTSSPYAAEVSYRGMRGTVPYYPMLRSGATLGHYAYQQNLLGESVALIPWLQFPVVEKGKLSSAVQLGAGAAWHSTPYHPRENNRNNMLGSRFSGALQLKSQLHYTLAKHWQLQAGLAMTHFSNGGSRMPNKGLNMLSAFGGVSYILSERTKAANAVAEVAKEPAGWQWQLLLATGKQQMKHVNTRRYSFLTVSASAFHPMNVKGGILLGGDLFYNPAIEGLVNYNQPTDSPAIDVYRMGLSAGYLMSVARLSILAQVGYYVYRPYDIYQPVYQRYGMRYRLTNHFFASAALKAHFGEAEAIEWGVGFSL